METLAGNPGDKDGCVAGNGMVNSEASEDIRSGESKPGRGKSGKGRLASAAIELRAPSAIDGFSVFKLVGACPPLDGNSVYCNLLQCSHFSGTSVAAVREGELVGFISGYLVPDRPRTLFVWQVAVGEQARGCGLASAMLENILDRPACEQVNHIETSITGNNRPSWSLFERLAKTLGAELNSSVLFDRQQHFNDEHDTEMLVRIGPFHPAVNGD